MTAQDDALLKALNDAMLDFNRACTREDAEGDPRDWVHAAYLHAWKAGRAYEASRATAGRAELEALRVIAAGMAACVEALTENHLWLSRARIALTLRNSLVAWADKYAVLAAAAPTAERRPDGDGGA